MKILNIPPKNLEIINEFNKIAGCKINIERSLAFLYTTNEISEREIKKIIPFTIASKRIKYLGIILTKEARPVLVTLQDTDERN